jgi:hypothetical protein
MLQKLGDHIAACRERANTCIAAATTEKDERIRTQLLALAQQWEHVATTYEFVASLERFLLDQQKGTLPTEVEKLPKDEPRLETPTGGSPNSSASSNIPTIHE